MADGILGGVEDFLSHRADLSRTEAAFYQAGFGSVDGAAETETSWQPVETDREPLTRFQILTLAISIVGLGIMIWRAK